MDDRLTAAETAFDEIAIEGVHSLCEFSVLVSYWNDSDLVVKALDDALKRFYKMKGDLPQHTMSKSAKDNVDKW